MATMLFIKPDNSSDTTSSTKDSERVVGTYYGENGSVLVLFENGTADYYWKEWERPVEDNLWHIEDNILIISLKNPKCEVTVDLPTDSLWY